MPELTLQKTLSEAESALSEIRLVGDLLIANWFEEDSDRKRDAGRRSLAEQLRAALENPAKIAPLLARRQRVERGPFPILPFHWEIEFPEVFGRENPGFRCNRR